MCVFIMLLHPWRCSSSLSWKSRRLVILLHFYRNQSNEEIDSMLPIPKPSGKLPQTCYSRRQSRGLQNIHMLQQSIWLKCQQSSIRQVILSLTALPQRWGHYPSRISNLLFATGYLGLRIYTAVVSGLQSSHRTSSVITMTLITKSVCLTSVEKFLLLKVRILNNEVGTRFGSEKWLEMSQ